MSRNLLANPGFEVDLATWVKIRGTETFTRDTGEFHSGVASGKIVTPGVQTEEGILYQEPLLIADGAEVKATVWMKGASGSFSVRSTIHDPFGVYQDLGSWATATLDGTWQQMSSSVTATSAAQGAGIEISTATTIGAVTVFLDDAELWVPYDWDFDVSLFPKPKLRRVA